MSLEPTEEAAFAPDTRRDPGAEVGAEPGPESVPFTGGGLSWTRVRLPRILSRSAKVLYGLSAVSLLVGHSLESAAGVLLGLSGAFAWPLFILSYIVSLNHGSFTARLEVSATELVIVRPDGKRRAIPRDQIASALVVYRSLSGGTLPTVEIGLKNGDLLTARLTDPGAVEAVVLQLGFVPGGTRVHASLARPTRRLLHPLFAGLAYVLVHMVVRVVGSSLLFEIAPLFTLALYTLIVLRLRAPEVTVGDDGVLVKRGLRERFFSRRDLSLSTDEAGDTKVSSAAAGGPAIVVGGPLLDEARRTAILRVAGQRAGRSEPGPERFTHYDRAGRGLEAWRAHLAQGMQEAGYRARAATVDDAVQVLGSPLATAEQRVGAALALRVAGEPGERIRVAVDGAADERARAALEAIADADDDVVIEKALRRLTW